MFNVYNGDRLVTSFRRECQALAYVREWKIKAGYTFFVVAE